MTSSEVCSAVARQAPAKKRMPRRVSRYGGELRAVVWLACLAVVVYVIINSSYAVLYGQPSGFDVLMFGVGCLAAYGVALAVLTAAFDGK